MLHANEIRMSSLCLGLRLVGAFTFFCALHIGNVFPSLVINPSINIRHSNSKRRNLFFLGYRDLTVFFCVCQELNKFSWYQTLMKNSVLQTFFTVWSTLLVDPMCMILFFGPRKESVMIFHSPFCFLK